MDLLVFIIFIVITMIRDIETVLLKKTDLKSFSTKKILFVSEEPSILQCAQRCKFRDKNAIIDYKDTTCKCVSNENADDDKDLHTLSGIFLNQETMKMKKEPRLINVALHMTASQSSTPKVQFGANNAVDGELSTFSFTKFKIYQWWSVELKDTLQIDHMVFKGCTKNYCNKKIIVETRQKQNEAWVNCKELGKVDTKSLKFECSKKTSARYVRISSTEECQIYIDEFEVYAYVFG